MPKKVFSVEKWEADSIKEGYSHKAINSFYEYWVKNCIGLTKKECESLGYFVRDNWFEKVPDKINPKEE